MAVAHDGAANVSSTIAGATSITLNKATAGSDRCAVAHTAAYPNGSVTALTYAGTAMSVMVSQSSADTSSTSSLHRFLAPTTASSAVVWTITGTTGQGAVGVTSYSGVHQTTPLGNTQQALGVGVSTHPSLTVTSAVGEMCMDALNVWNPPTRTVGAGQTQIFNLTDTDAETSGNASYEAGAASVVMDWTLSETVTNYYNHVAAALLPSVGATTTNPGWYSNAGGWS